MTLHQLLRRNVKRGFAAFASATFFFLKLHSVDAATWVTASEQKDTTDLMQNINFRNIGPAAAGGRVSAVVGIPGQPNIYYIGAAGGRRIQNN